MLHFPLMLFALASPDGSTHECCGLDGGSCRVIEVHHARAVPIKRCDDDNDVIDMLWVVTEQAMAYMGGPDAVLDEVLLAMHKANDAFANTTLPFRTNLVGLHVTDYPQWYSNYLYQLQDPNDGFMDDVPVVRNAKAADIVSLITVEGYCGVAFLAPNSPEWGYQANSAYCLMLDGASPMRHELGHNLGSRHYSSDGGGYLPYSAGHVLELSDGTTVGTCMAGNSIPHYSNPEVDWEGVPTGIAPGEPGEADNFTAFTQTVPMVADFRCSTHACRGDIDLDGVVGADDLLAVLGQWGPAATHPADVVVDGQCNVEDVLLMIGTWGTCP